MKLSKSEKKSLQVWGESLQKNTERLPLIPGNRVYQDKTKYNRKSSKASLHKALREFA